nr:unnamed protein product [Callosobruchus analis]
MLKGSGIVVKEDLTDNRLKLMQAAIEKTSLKGYYLQRRFNDDIMYAMFRNWEGPDAIKGARTSFQPLKPLRDDSIYPSGISLSSELAMD